MALYNKYYNGLGKSYYGKTRVSYNIIPEDNERHYIIYYYLYKDKMIY